MYYWIIYAIWLLCNVMYGGVFAMALTPRWKRFPRWSYALTFALFFLIPSSIKYLDLFPGQWGDVGYWVGQVILLIYAFYCFREKIWKKLLLFFLFNIVTYVAEIITQQIMATIGIAFDVTFQSMSAFLYVGCDLCLMIMLYGLLLLGWNYLTHRTRTPRYFGLFLLFPVSQLMTLYYLNGELTSATMPYRGSLISCIGVLLGFVADFVLMYVLLQLGEKERLARQVQDMETMQQLQELHFQAIEARREELAKIRHDFNNQLSVAYHLMEQGREEQASALLDQLKQDIVATKEYEYCGNPVVNAVLTEKSAMCEKLGIRLTADIELSEETRIRPLHLCSVFSNLLDNAIQALEQCPTKERSLSIAASHRGDYLVIKTENPTQELKKQKGADHEDGHGYGLLILSEIATRYQGELHWEYKDGTFRTVLSLDDPLA